MLQLALYLAILDQHGVTARTSPKTLISKVQLNPQCLHPGNTMRDTVWYKVDSKLPVLALNLNKLESIMINTPLYLQTNNN